MDDDEPTPTPPPDPTKVAQAQTGSNISTAIANSILGNANQVGPLGSTTFNQSGMQTITGPNGERYQVPQYTQTTQLSPEQQQLYNQGVGLQGQANTNAAGALGQPFSLSGLPDVSNDFSADRARVEQAMFQRLNPQLTQSREAEENRLVNQGFQRGTDAFRNAMDNLNRQENDLRLGVTERGLQEQQGLFGMSQANRGRALSELLTSRNQPIQELNALRTGAIPNMPNVQGYQGGQVGNTPIGDYIYNTAALQNKQYEQQMAQQNAAMGGMYGLGGAALGAGGRYLASPGGNAAMSALGTAAMGFMSDRRLKRDIRDLGIRLMNGIKLYAYRYIWEARERVGVMADEVLRVRPQAVHVRGGYLAVDYGAL